MEMTEYSETFGNLRIYQNQVDGWVTGTYNTFITYSGEILAIKYHRHETRSRDKEIPDDGIYNLTNGQDIIGQCSLYKELLNNVTFLKSKMEAKMRRGIKYNFDIEFVGNILKKTVDTVHEKIESIYFDLQFEAASTGRKFNIPLPDYTTNNTAEDNTENDQSTSITMKNGNQNEIIELMKKADYIIELVKELKPESSMPEYIRKLIEQGYIGQDGITALTGLDNIAEFLFTRIESLSPELLLQFRQSNGSEYSKRSAQDAVKRSRT
jgi:hypothetical protein